MRRGIFRDITEPLCEILGYSKSELIEHDYFSLISTEEQTRLLNEVFPLMLRNVAFENNIPIELNILQQNQTTITLIGTVNIENDIPEPSFLVDILDHKSIEQIKGDGAEKGHMN